MPRRLLILVLIVVMVGDLAGQATIVLNKPKTFASITGYDFASLEVRRLPTPRILVTFQAPTGAIESFAYPCSPPDAPSPCTTDTDAETLTLIGQLNTVNLSTRSLQLRIADRLCADFPSRFPDGCTVQ